MARAAPARASTAPRRPGLPVTRRLLRGARRAFAIACLSLAAAVLFAVAFVHTPRGRSKLRGALERWASSATGGSVRLADLDLDAWRGEANASAARLELRGVLVEVPRATIRWSLTKGPRLVLHRPVIVVRDTGASIRPSGPAAGLAAQPWRVLERFARVEVTEARLELQDETGTAWLVLDRFDLDADVDSRRATLRVADGSFGWPGAGLPVRGATGDAQLRLEADRLVFEHARVLAGSSSVEASGQLERIEPITARASGHAALDGTLVETLAPGSGLAGRMEAAAAVEVVSDRVTGTLEASSPALTVGRLGPWNATGRGRFEGARLLVDAFDAAGLGGRIEASGPLALGSSAGTEMNVRARGFDVAVLVSALGGASLPVSARADGTLAWSAQGWDIEGSRGEGRITLAAGRGRGLRPAGDAAVRLRGRELVIEQARLGSHGAAVTARARIRPGGEIEGRWTAELPLGASSGLLADLGSPARPPHVTGMIVAEGDVTGSVSHPRGTATLRSDGLAAHGEPLALAASLSFDASHLSMDPLVLRSGSGQATFTGSVPLAAKSAWDVAGAIEAFDTRPLQRSLGLPGSGAASGTLRVTGPRDGPKGALSARVNATLPRPDDVATEDAVVIDVDAAIEPGRIQVERLDADLAGGRVSGRGRFDTSSRELTASLEATGLAWNRWPLLPPGARRLSGMVAGRLTVSGHMDAPAGDLQLALADAALGGAALPLVSVSAHSDGRELRIESAAPDVFLRGRGPLAGERPLELELDASRLPLQPLIDGLVPAAVKPLELAAEGTVALSLPLRDPSRLTYSSKSLSASGSVRRNRWTLAPFAVRGDRDSVMIEGLEVSAGKARLSARGRVGLAPTSPFDFQVESDVDLADLDGGEARRPLGGTGRLRLAVAGTREAPRLSGTLALNGVRGTAEDALLQRLDLDARFVGRELEVVRLTADVLGGQATADGRVPLFGGGGERARFRFALRDVDLARSFGGERTEDAAAPAVLLSMEGDADAGDLSLASLSARGRVTRLETRSAEGGLALAEPAGFSLRSRHAALDPLRLSGTLGRLEARAEADLDAASPRASASLAGELDLRALEPFLPGTSLGGSARIDTRLTRAGESWRLDGGVRVERARLALDALHFALGDVTGELRFEGDRAALDATGSAGDGRLSAKGVLSLGPTRPGTADITVEADRVPVQHPPGLRGRASGSVRLTGEPGRYRLAGTVSMSQGYYTAEVDAQSQSLDRLDWQLAALEGGSLTDQVALDVGVRLAEPLRVRNQTMRLDVEGAIAASGTLAQPTMGGQVTLRDGGELTLGRARVRVQRGTVVLNGYPAGTPSVDFEGATRVGGVAVEVAARGPMDDLQLTLGSDRSDLSQTDLVTLLLTGRTASTAASESGEIIAEQLAVALGGMLQKGVGSALLIDVSPDRSLLADNTDPTQRFHIGTRITQNTTVVYSAALDGAEKQWIVEFNPGGGRFRLRAISEEDNSFSMEVSDRLTFDLWSRGRGRAPREIDRLSGVRFEGEPKLPLATLRGALKLKAGRRYSGLQREQAADRVRDRLVRAGYRSTSVDALTERAAGGGVLLVMRVEAGPLVPIEWTGDDPGGKVREAAEAAWPPLATPELAASLVARAALVRLQADGHYAATVAHEVTAAADRVAVRMQVSRGPKGTGVDVAFEGNHALDDAALSASLPRPGRREFFEALDARSPRIGNDVRLAYARIGYVRARVGAPRTAFDPASGRLKVTIPVRERGPSTVAAVELPDEAARASGLALRLKPGQPFDLAAYVSDREALSAWYVANGWVEAQARGVLEARGASVSVRYVVEAGPRPRVAGIRVAQDGKTRDAVIRRSLAVKEGDFVRPAALADSRERLTDVGVFRSVDVRAEPRADDPARRDVVVGLVDKPDVQFEYGLRYTTQGEGGAGSAPSSATEARLQLAGALELVNPFGYGVKARAYGFGTTSRQSWGASLDAATLAGWRLRTQLFLFNDNDDDLEVSGIASHVRGVTAQQSRVLLRDRRRRRWHERLRLQWAYTFKDIEYVESAEGAQILQGDRGFGSLALIGDERDNLTDPRKGLFWTATSELARTWLGSDVDYVRLYGQLFAYVPLGPLVWAQGYRVGVVPGTDPLLLLEKRFHAGGPTTVRGFEQNELGPQTVESDSLGGQALVVLNQELRFPIAGKLKGGLFWDAGNVWATSGELDFGDLRHSAGAGLRYIFPFGPVRIEYAWILHRREGEPKGRFVFGLGHAF